MSTFLSFPSIHHIFHRLYLGENIPKLHDTIATYSSEFSIDLFSKKSSFALWFQFTILNIVDYYYIPRRSSIDSSRKKGGEGTMEIRYRNK